MCLKCVDENGNFCPKGLFHIDKIKRNGADVDIIKFDFKKISKCQGCLKCELSCPEQAIKPIKFEPKP